MRPNVCFFVTTVSIVSAVACGGRVLELGQDGASCDVVAGMSATDLFCAWRGALAHWDGASWTRIAVPPRIAPGIIDAYSLTPAGPGELWYASSTGLARVRASGDADDFTDSFGAIALGGPLFPYLARGGGEVYLLWPAAGGEASDVFAFAGGAFQQARAPSGVTAVVTHPLAAGGDALWGLGSGGDAVVRGTEPWTGVLVPVDRGSMAVTARDFWAVSGKDDSHGKYNCLGGCDDPGSATTGVTGKADWRLVFVSGGDPSVASEVVVPVPADLHSLGVSYDGRTILPSADGHVALVACVRGRDGDAGAGSGAVVNVWDGSALGPTRDLPSGVACPSAHGHDRPLDDGTWVFGAASGISLVRP